MGRWRVPQRRATTASRVVVREYGRDSLLVWANLLLAPLLPALGLRVGLESDERLAARIEGDAAAMRKRGYLLRSVETFSVPVIGGRAADAHWYRVTFEQAAASPEVPESGTTS